MDFRILGTLEVRSGDMLASEMAPRTRTVLALLLARAGQLVSVDQLVDELWPDRPPREARQLAQGYVSRVRRALRPFGGESRLVTRRPGYVLRVEAAELDAQRFEDTLSRARQAQSYGRLTHSLDLLRQGEREWRGSAFCDVPMTRVLVAEARRLEELRLSAREDLFDTGLRLRQERMLIPELDKCAAEHPARTRLVGQLMVALHRSGRVSEALAAYRRSERYLADELGMDPPGELKRLHVAILRDDDRREVVPIVPATAAVVDVSSRRPASFNLKRQYLTHEPDPSAHRPTSIERTIWLVGGEYDLWQDIEDFTTQSASRLWLPEGQWQWRDMLVPESGCCYRHETALTRNRNAPVRHVTKRRLGGAGLYTWGSRLEPKF